MVRGAPNANTLQSHGRNKVAGLSGGLIRRTRNGKAADAIRLPNLADVALSDRASIKTSCTSRDRPAPTDTRSAISLARAVVRATMRFATFAHAISSTSAANTARANNGRP